MHLAVIITPDFFGSHLAHWSKMMSTHVAGVILCIELQSNLRLHEFHLACNVKTLKSKTTVSECMCSYAHEQVQNLILAILLRVP